jgi:hypothetical protein
MTFGGERESDNRNRPVRHLSAEAEAHTRRRGGR